MEQNILHGPKPQYPKPEVPLGVYLYNKLMKHGSKTAMIDAVTGETRTFDELLTKSLSVAQYLVTLGIKTGDVVGICSENSIDFVIPVLAAYYIGASCSTFNPAYATIVFGFPHSHTQIPFTKMLRDKSRTFQPLDVDYNNATAAILYSSGTTGLPKGVVITQNSVLALLGYTREPKYINIAPSDVLLGLLPMFHTYAFFSTHLAVAVGIQVVVMKKFEEQVFLEAVHDFKISLLHLVPPLVMFLAKHPLVEKCYFSTIREICCAAAPLSAEMEALVVQRLGIGQIRQMYGMTETSHAVLLMPPAESRKGSTGTLAPGFSCKVVDVETGKLMGPNEKGELRFKGPLVMKGYLGDELATAQAFDEDGFLHTGDIGYYDNDGFFYIIDRVKELIKYKGYQVPPAELEAILLLHPAVKDVGVVGKPDEVAGELPMAFIVQQSSKQVTEEELVQFVADQVSPQKRLRGGVKFVNSIPKTPSGKILRQQLRKAM